MRSKNLLGLSLLAAAVVLTAGARAARADEGGAFGLGLEMGAPTGLAAKYYFGNPGRHHVAIQGGLGVVERFGDDGVHLHAEVVWHPAVLARTPDLTMPFYLGVGFRFLDDDDDDCWRVNGNLVCDVYGDDDGYLGVRAPFGLLLDFKKVPLDVFVELALVVDVVHLDDDDVYDDYHDDVSLGGSLGLRYYF